jgi:hypothetical protein
MDNTDKKPTLQYLRDKVIDELIDELFNLIGKFTFLHILTIPFT